MRVELTARGEPFQLHDAWAELEGFELPLLPLAQECAKAPRASWRARVADELSRRSTEEKLGSELDALRGDFDKARRALKLRVQRDETVGPNAISAPIASNLRAVLVLDLPSFITPVRPADLASWEKPADFLVASALENVKSSEQVELKPMEIAGTRVFAVSGRSVFVATLGLAAEDLLGKPTPFGALVAMPSAHILLCHALADARSVKALEAMAAGSLQAFESGPSPLCPDLFWKKADRFTALRVHRDEGEVKCELPREFDEQVVQRLLQSPAHT
ncbi:MAG TPA: hypothetical protein VLW85_23615 [Myxococcales bacterium]|nr:hypothetical protein [Myxococcales bacterium]